MTKDTRLVAEAFEGGLDRLADARLAGLAATRNLEIGYRALLENEIARLESARGEERPRAALLRAALEANRSLVRGLDAELGTARIEVPRVGDDQALVDGRVTDREGRGLTGLTVCLVDRQGEALDGTEPATTDASGYYAMVGAAPGRDDANEPKGGYPRKGFLAVFTPKGTLLHREKRAVEPAAGERVTVNVTLDRREVFGVRPAGPGTGKAGVEKARKGKAGKGKAGKSKGGEEKARRGKPAEAGKRKTGKRKGS